MGGPVMISDPAAHWMDLKLGPPTQESRNPRQKRERRRVFFGKKISEKVSLKKKYFFSEILGLSHQYHHRSNEKKGE